MDSASTAELTLIVPPEIPGMEMVVKSLDNPNVILPQDSV
jgi:hypothetical protein